MKILCSLDFISETLSHAIDTAESCRNLHTCSSYTAWADNVSSVEALSDACILHLHKLHRRVLACIPTCTISTAMLLFILLLRKFLLGRSYFRMNKNEWLEPYWLYWLMHLYTYILISAAQDFEINNGIQLPQSSRDKVIQLQVSMLSTCVFVLKSVRESFQIWLQSSTLTLMLILAKALRVV